jgi:hypothetical protein
MSESVLTSVAHLALPSYHAALTATSICPSEASERIDDASRYERCSHFIDSTEKGPLKIALQLAEPAEPLLVSRFIVSSTTYKNYHDLLL